MGFSATVLRVMIASPSDMFRARDAVENALSKWNTANTESRAVVVLPWRWETASVPVLGDHPQSLINSQGVDQSDIVIALFGSRLGSATPKAVSGTVEEVQRAVESGKPVHLYFSSAPHPPDVDTGQLDGLRAFREQVKERGLLGEFSTVEQLEFEVWKAIDYDLAHIDLAPSQAEPASAGVRFTVQPGQERELRAFNNRGNPQYTTRHWIDIANVGSEDALDVEFEVVGERSSMRIVESDGPTVIHAGQSRRVGVFHHMGGGDPDVIRIRWSEDGEARSREYHVG